MKQISFLLNNREITMPLKTGKSILDTLRNDLDLFGTKEGCREGECGACTVILGRLPSIPYRSMPSCLLSAGQVASAHLVTIEGLDLGRPNRIQEAFIKEGATQCGFCTPGFIVALTGYLMSGRMISLQGALNSLDGNICRCTGYGSIRRAVEWAVNPLLGSIPTIEDLVQWEILPQYFLESLGKLVRLQAQNKEDQESDPDNPGPLVAGGTDLYVQKGDELPDQAPRFLIPESEPITLEGEYLSIPATASMEQFRLDPQLNQQFPLLDEKMLWLASHILRNRATIGGNLVNASPIADTAVLLLAWDAQIKLRSPQGKERILPLQSFYLGYKQLAKEPQEFLSSILVKKSAGPEIWNFTKVSKRDRLDIASCNSAVNFHIENNLIKKASIGIGGVAPIPFTAQRTMEWLAGRPLSVQSFLESITILKDEIAPIDDVRGTAEYKRTLAGAQLADHYLRCFPEHCEYEDFVQGGVL